MLASPRRIRAPFSSLLLAGAMLFACGSEEGRPPPSPFATLGELHDAIAAALASTDDAVRRDTDGDRIPDSIEAVLGTSPVDRDSDRDGLVDNYELFGTGVFVRSDPLPDLDGDGVIAPVDVDDNSDGTNDGEAIDSDGDGIANYLEYYGYTYDWLTEAFVPWDGDPAVPHFRTDPLQQSTDQDAYSDAAEVTGIGLDVTVRPPGDHPLVPATPNIVLELVGYSVTLNQTITYEEGRSLAVGQTWERSTEQSHSYTDERNWEVGIEAGYASSSGQFLVHANYGESYSNTQTTSTATAMGTSVLNDQQWSVARTTNPIDVARVKLFVKVHNLGGAPLSAIVPTLSLKIGGLGVSTFEPDAQTHILVPGETYPDDPQVTWVIDSGAGGKPLALTMRELRALENGAPVSISVTQLRGDVMRLSDEAAWERIGDFNEYVARCEAVSANIRFDLGDGTFVHHLVYADDGASGVPVTLRDALALLGVGDDAVLRFTDRTGAYRAISLDGYSFVFDTETLRRNGWLFEGEVLANAPADMALDQIRLFPGTNLLVRAPREVAGAMEPVIHFAYIDREAAEVKVCASDYQGITSAVVKNHEGGVIQLDEDIPGAGFFSTAAGAETFELGEEYTVVVTNRRGQTAERPLAALFTNPGPRKPFINTVTLDLASHRVYANISSGAPDDPSSEIEWVRAYHPGLPGTFVALDVVPNFFEDPNGFVAPLPPAFASSNLEIVAYVAPEVFSRHLVTESEVVTARVAGTVWLTGHIDTSWIDEEWRVPRFDLDNGAYASSFYEAASWSASWSPGPPADLWVMVDEDENGWLHVNGAYVFMPSGYTYETLTPEIIAGLVPSQTARLNIGAETGIRTGDVLAIATTEGRYAKARVVTTSSYDNWWTNAHDRTIVIEYVTFESLPPPP